uniref:HYR-like domain-containing protein n=1 Tax=uncultured Sunxiuqinia sp. TaxID=1573825 RepID=UPI002608AA31
WSYTYTIDIPDFVANMPADGSSTVDCLADAQVQPTPPAVNDYCGNPITPTLVTTPADISCAGDMVWVFNYEDCEGNNHDWSYTYTIDIPDFVANMPADGSSTVDCLADAQVQPTPPAVNDYCGNPITPTLVTTPADIPCTGDMVWVFNYEDCEGNNHDWSYTYTIDIPDFMANIPAPGASTVECIGDATEPVPPVVSDACSGETTVELVGVTDAPDPITNNGTRTYTFRYLDCANNEAMWTYVYTIEDTQDPTITCPTTVSVPADPGVCYTLAENVDLGTPTTDDNCAVASVTNDAPVQFLAGDTPVTWTVTDVAGNTATCVQIVTVYDAEDPAVNCPVSEDQVVEANESCAYLHSGTGWDAMATDNCGVSSLSYVLTGATIGSGDTTLDGVEFNLGETTITWTAVNGTGNEVSCSFNVIVNDVSAPTFTCNDLMVTLDENDYYAITPEDLALLATDIQGECDEDVSDFTISVDTQEFTCETMGEQTVTVSVTDASGNTSTCETTITVMDMVDPVVECAGDVEVTLPSDEDCMGFVTVPAPSYSDNCGVASITNDYNNTADASGEYLVGETLVTWTVTDNYGNTVTCEQLVVLRTAPLAVDDQVDVNENEELVIYVLDNDLDCDENLDNTSLKIITPPAEGTATVNVDGTIRYKPNVSYYGNDQLSYQICDADGACAEAVVDITIVPNDDLLIPNGFSPNGDGINDYFRVRGIHKYPNAQIEIYNRWGVKVFKRDRYGDIGMYGNPGAWWDGRPNVKGTSNSEILPEGTYFIILILDGSNVHKGTLYINR